MKKTLVLPVLAAAALLAGCRTYQPGSVARRTVFEPRTAASEPKQAAAKPVEDVSSIRPATVQTTAAAPSYKPVSTTPSYKPVSSTPSYKPVATAPSYQPAVATPAPVPAAQPTPAPVAQPASVAPRAPVVAAGSYAIYTVQPGDIAGRIANDHGMTLKQFKELNGLSDEQAGMLRVGQTVKIATGRAPLAAGPAVKTPAPASVPGGSTYTIQPGDTLSQIASANGMTTASLMAMNGISDANRIRVGQTLRLKADAAAASVKTVQATVPAAPAVVPTTKSAAEEKLAADRKAAEEKLAAEAKKAAAEAKAAEEKLAAEANAAEAKAAEAKAAVERKAQEDAAKLQAVEEAAKKQFEADKAATSDMMSAFMENGTSISEQKEAALSQAGAAAASAAAATPGVREYVVEQDDDIWTISEKFNVKPMEIRMLNGNAVEALRPGQTIKIPVAQ